MGNRSTPGLGEPISLYLLGSAESLVDGVVRHHGETAMCGSVGEDYAESMWPVVDKVKSGVTREQLAQHLRDAADAVEKNRLFMEVDQDGPAVTVGGVFSTPASDEGEEK